MLQTSDPPPVHPWPDGAAPALDALRCDRAWTVISIGSPDTTLRHAARTRIRRALQELLGAFLCRPAASIVLHSQPGQALALALDWPQARMGLSVSHAPGLSVAAIRVGGAIGVDLMRMEPGVEGMSDWACVAQNYLGPRTCSRIAALAPAQRAEAFAQAWTGWEAGLKCLGMGLTEWTPALAQRMASCDVRPLALPGNYHGAIATR